jgi:hypothetical protein
MEYQPILALFSVFRCFILWKLGSESGSGSASNKNPDPHPNPHQSDAGPQHCQKLWRPFLKYVTRAA